MREVQVVVLCDVCGDAGRRTVGAAYRADFHREFEDPLAMEVELCEEHADAVMAVLRFARPVGGDLSPVPFQIPNPPLSDAEIGKALEMFPDPEPDPEPEAELVPAADEEPHPWDPAPAPVGAKGKASSEVLAHRGYGPPAGHKPLGLPASRPYLWTCLVHPGMTWSSPAGMDFHYQAIHGMKSADIHGRRCPLDGESFDTTYLLSRHASIGHHLTVPLLMSRADFEGDDFGVVRDARKRLLANDAARMPLFPTLDEQEPAEDDEDEGDEAAVEEAVVDPKVSSLVDA